MILSSTLNDISVTTFTIRLKRPFAFGSFERFVELRWLDDAIDWVVTMGYEFKDIEEVSFEQDGVCRVFEREEVEKAIARLQENRG